MPAGPEGGERVEDQAPPAADRRPIFALLGANAVSQVGNMMTAVAVPWFVLETTGSAARTGLTGAAIAIGAVVPAVLGGPLVDRVGHRRASVLADVASGITVGAIPLLHVAGVLAFWQLLVLVFLFASLNAQGDTARYALVPGLAHRARMPVERANTADRAMARFAQLVGPVLAGVLIAVVGASNVLLVDTVTFALSAAFVAVGVPSAARAHQQPKPETKNGYLSDLLEGLRYVRANRLVLSMVLVAMVGNFLDIPLVSVVLPVYAKAVYGSAPSLGLVLGALGAGALAGTLLFGAVRRRFPRRLTFISCYVGAPIIVYAALAATPPLMIAVAAGFLGGLIAGPINPLLQTVIQENTPPQMLGRVFGVLNALAQAGIPVGTALAGFVIEGVGLVPTILGMGAIYVTVTLGMFLNPALRRMDAPGEAVARQS